MAETMTYEEFVRARVSVPDDEKEPFCPFTSCRHMGYCNIAYSDECYHCIESLDEYRDSLKPMRDTDPLWSPEETAKKLELTPRALRAMIERWRTELYFMEEPDKCQV